MNDCITGPRPKASRFSSSCHTSIRAGAEGVGSSLIRMWSHALRGLKVWRATECMTSHDQGMSRAMDGTAAVTQQGPTPAATFLQARILSGLLNLLKHLGNTCTKN